MNNTDKHDIEEMAKGQIGLKWPTPIMSLSYIHINVTSTKQITHEEDKTNKQTNKQTKMHAPKLPKWIMSYI